MDTRNTTLAALVALSLLGIARGASAQTIQLAPVRVGPAPTWLLPRVQGEFAVITGMDAFSAVPMPAVRTGTGTSDDYYDRASLSLYVGFAGGATIRATSSWDFWVRALGTDRAFTSSFGGISSHDPSITSFNSYVLALDAGARAHLQALAWSYVGFGVQTGALAVSASLVIAPVGPPTSAGGWAWAPFARATMVLGGATSASRAYGWEVRLAAGFAMVHPARPIAAPTIDLALVLYMAGPHARTVLPAP